MAIERVGGQGDGVAFLVAAGIVYEIVAAACSSPQTTEINAKTRSSTLMKWVHIGLVQSVLFVGAAAYFDRSRAVAYLTGGGAAALIMYGSYIHAQRAGVGSDDPGTEQGTSAPGGPSMLAWGNPT